MLRLLIIGLGACVQAGAGDSAPSAGIRDQYDRLRQQVGRDAGEQVELALWCERHGLNAERARHLGLAILIDPDHGTARGLLGHVRDGEAWRRPGTAPPIDAAATALLEEYQRRRADLRDNADGHMRLAAWCDGEGLTDEARAHYWNALALDPTRDAAYRRLGYKKHDGRWFTDAQIAALKAERAAQQEADRLWGPSLDRLRDRLRSNDADDREAAQVELSSIRDPRSVPSAWKAFADGDASDQARLVQLLGQVDSTLASQRLAFIAVASNHAEVRRLATESLRRRDPREFAAPLIALIGEPIRYSVQPVGGPGSPGVLKIETKGYDLHRVYTPPPTPGPLPTDQIGLDANGQPVAFRFLGARSIRLQGREALDQAIGPAPEERMGPIVELLRRRGADAAADALEATAPRLGGVPITDLGESGIFDLNVTDTEVIPLSLYAAEANRAAVAAQIQLERDVRMLEAYNGPVVFRNERVFPVLHAVAGPDVPDDRHSWNSWLADLLGVRAIRQVTARRGSVVEPVPIGFQAQPVGGITFTQQNSAVQAPVVVRTSCFVAGTPVWTDRGPRAIESFEIGDRVLAVDPATGSLGYRAVTRCFANPPSPTSTIRLGRDEVTCSHSHRFWKPAVGWVMARDLKPGDQVRVIGGLATIESIADAGIQPVFNLDVDTDANFFVGETGALVHDNTVPGLRVRPFDAIAPE